VKITPQVISREAAHMQGLKRYYTATPCVKGHDAQRYVSTGGCVDCLTKQFKFRRSAYSHDLGAFTPSNLWAPKSLTPEESKALERYVQSCIAEFTKHIGKLTPDLDDAFRMQLERM